MSYFQNELEDFVLEILGKLGVSVDPKKIEEEETSVGALTDTS